MGEIVEFYRHDNGYNGYVYSDGIIKVTDKNNELLYVTQKSNYKDFTNLNEFLDTFDLSISYPYKTSFGNPIFLAKSCPFCGTRVQLSEEDGSYFVECGWCHLETPHFESREEAIDYWDTRKETELSGG